MADNEELKEKYEALKLENQEGYEIVAELKHECEQKEKELKELKRQYKLSCLDCEYKNTKADVDRYRKALEEIEKVINNILNSCLGRNTVSCRPAHNVCGDLININDIINKAKGADNAIRKYER